MYTISLLLGAAAGGVSVDVLGDGDGLFMVRMLSVARMIAVAHCKHRY